MGFLDKLFPRVEARSEMDFTQYFKLLQAHGVGRQALSYNGKAEEVSDAYDWYAENLYKSNAIVFAVARARADIFSEIQFKWRPLDEPATPYNLFGTKDLALLENPWPGGTTGDLLKRAILDVDIAGNFFCAREYDKDRSAYRLRRLRPDWVKVILTADPRYATRSDVFGYSYHPGGYGNGIEEVYLPEDICHWTPSLDPSTNYLGMSWMQPIVKDVQVQTASTQHRLNFFERGAHLGIAVMVKDGDTTGEQMQEFKDKFMSKYAGLKNSFEPLFVGAGADIKFLESDLKSLDTKAIAGISETHIANVAGVPAVVVGLAESQGSSALNQGNYKVAARGFIDGTIRPLWRGFCDAMTPLVGPPTRRGGKTIPARLWYDAREVAVLNDDRKEDAEVISSHVSSMGILIDKGFTPESVTEFVKTSNPDVLVHTGLISVQLYEPGADDPANTEPNVNTDPNPHGANPVTPKKKDTPKPETKKGEELCQKVTKPPCLVRPTQLAMSIVP